MRRLAAVGALAYLGLMMGCDSVDVDDAANSSQTLCLADYQQCIDPIFNADLSTSQGFATCSASGCHDQGAGSGGGFKIFPELDPADADYDQRSLANFTSAKAFANLNNPNNSKLLLEPLTGASQISGVHTGGDVFPDTTDVCYQTIHAWISRAVDDPENAACGVCTVPDVNACGF